MSETLNTQENGNNANTVLAGRCFSCKNWTYDYFVLHEYSNRHKRCNLATEDDSGGFMDAICSGEGIGGQLITRDDFGCVLYNAANGCG